MITASRNLLIVLVGFVCAFLVSALGQAAFSLLFPAFSSRVAANVDFATYFVLVLAALAYFLFGFMVPRWLRSSWPLLWLLTPIVLVYLLAIAQPYPYRCNPFAFAGCWMIQSIFVVPAVAIAMGYLFRARRQRHSNVV
jgi:hypothetical protein